MYVCKILYQIKVNVISKSKRVEISLQMYEINV